MFRVVSKAESDFKESVWHHVMQFVQDEGLSWAAATDSKAIDESIYSIASSLWFIKQNVKSSEQDLLNTRDARRKLEEDMRR